MSRTDTDTSPGHHRCQDHDATRPPTDVRDMLVVHTALLREFRLAPAAVARVAPGDRRRAAVTGRHLSFVCDLLRTHHEGEDELLWPLLRERLPDAALPLLDQAEAQHAGLAAALERVTGGLPAWAGNPGGQAARALAEDLRALHALLAEHLDAEERTLLPLAAAHLTAREWKAIGDHAVACLHKSALPLVFGLFAYEGDPAVLRDMLRTAPVPVRLIVPRIAPRLYARRAARVHGTARP